MLGWIRNYSLEVLLINCYNVLYFFETADREGGEKGQVLLFHLGTSEDEEAGERLE